MDDPKADFVYKIKFNKSFYDIDSVVDIRGQEFISEDQKKHVVMSVAKNLGLKYSPQNLPKADAYSLLADVLDEWISDLETEGIYILPKLLEKMKSFRVKHFS